jgi:hypothetical protein
MKNLLLISFSIFIFSLTAQAQDAEFTGPVMTFESEVVDYGAIAQNSEPLRVVAFTNTGTEPLIVKNARGSCGCTVPTWPKEPVMPGETSQIEVRYDTKRIGSINKKITLTTNEPEGANTHILKVIGKISKADAGVPEKKDNMFTPEKN